mmetsp:Transcript_13307/g.32495  ORF Transcript_13307/g.32495 Transcript_13307/m.32495 type:complete len:304 (+) Transcript_13307:259-1170(+)
MSSSLISLEDWTARPIVKMVPSMVGRHVRIDPFDFDRDVILLWKAFTASHTTHKEEDEENPLDLQTKIIDEYLRWILEFFKMESFENLDGFKQFLQRIHTDPTNALLVFRLIHDEDDDDDYGNVSTCHDTDKNVQVVCGFAVYCYNSPEDGVVEIGIAHGQAMAQTVASTEVHYLLARYVFECLKYRRYEWKCDKFNIKSNKAADRLGFRYEGCFRQSFVVTDSSDSSQISFADNKKKKKKLKSRDTNWYSMLDCEWSDCKDAFEQWLDTSNFDTETRRQKKRLQDFQRWRVLKEMDEKKEEQ